MRPSAAPAARDADALQARFVSAQHIPLSSAAEAELERRKTALLFRNADVALLGTLVNAGLLSYVNVSLNMPSGLTVAWLAVVVAIAAGRCALARAFLARLPDAQAAAAWRRRQLAGTAAAGAAWGIGAACFVWQGSDTARLFTGLVACGVVAGAIPLLTPVPWAFRSFALSLHVPLAAAIFAQASTPVDWALGVFSLLFMGVLLASSRYLHATLDAGLRLGLTQSELASRLEGARDAAEAALAEREIAESTRRASEERYGLILANSPAGIVHFDRNLVITYINERWAQILQVPRERLIGVDMTTLKDLRFMPAMRAALEGRQGRYEGEYKATQSQVEIWISMSCTPFVGPTGETEGGIAIIEDVTERRRSEDEIRNLAYYDPLTRLPNRRLLLDRLGHAMSTANRSRNYGALLILDLDHFKSINDTQGHDVGDRLLVEVARRLTACLRESDTVSRLGGDEYVVLLETLGPSETQAAALVEGFAERMLQAVRAPYVLGGSEAEYFSTTSIGVTLFRGQESATEVLLKQADVALYQAKNAGRNTARFFSPAMQASIETRAAMESALRRGLDRGEFLLHYQPQLDNDGRLFGAEALIRWQPAGQDMVPPGKFIALAEETGLILPIGQWVFEQACAQLQAWARDPRTRELRLSINVSARQFQQADFVDQVHAGLQATGVEAARLKFELTEHVVLEQNDAVLERLRRLAELGVSFALDDFGTGYSSLSYLKRLPLEQVKIDQSFVRDVPGDPNDAAIVRAILAMSRTLGLQVIAEGVETLEQHRFLAVNGCTHYQGYLFSPPLPIASFEDFVRSWQPDTFAFARAARELPTS